MPSNRDSSEQSTLSKLLEAEDFKALLNSFKQLAEEANPIFSVHIEYGIIQFSRLYRVPLSSFRRMFKNYLNEKGRAQS